MHGARPAIEINVPTRWATNFFVVDSQLKSLQALQMAAASEGWAALPAGGKAREVRSVLMSADYWTHADRLVRLLRPFSDANHQFEGDKPHLADCHVTLLALRKHVEDWSSKYRTSELGDSDGCPVTDRAITTMDRRLDAQPGGAVAPVYNPAYSAAFVLDPYYADVDESPDGQHCSAGALSATHMDAARALVLRVGGATAAAQFARMFTQGYPKAMQHIVAGVAGERLKAEARAAPARKRDRCNVPGSKERLAVWQKFGSDVPELRDVALRLLSAHATSAAPERNWSLWGRVYCAARSALGMQRAKALIAICAAERAKVSPSEAFEITLSVVEENVSP
jgi:hypothetical protein